MDESKKERKLTKGELNSKIHPMLAIKRDLKCNCCNDSKILILLSLQQVTEIPTE